MPFSPEQAERICNYIAEEGLTLRQVAEKEKISAALIVWNANKSPQFAEQYARALEIRAERDFEVLVDQVFETPERTPNGIDPAWVNLKRLQTDTIKWALSKRNPKKYGEKIQQELTGDLSLTLADTISKARKRLE